MSAPPAPLRDLRSCVHTVVGTDDEWVLQRHGAPATPVAAACLWESSLYRASGAWFNSSRSAGAQLGLGFVLISRSKQVARFRVSTAHQQPSGLLHGGVSALVAEEMGSIAAALNVAPLPVVGISVTATHLASAKIGDIVTAVCTPIKGKGKLQVWRIDLFKDDAAVENVLAGLEPNPDSSVDQRALYYRDFVPKGPMLATCQLTATARPPSNDAKTSFPVPVAAPTRSKL